MFMGGATLIYYWANDIKNVKRPSGYQYTYTGLDTHLKYMALGASMMVISIII